MDVPLERRLTRFPRATKAADHDLLPPTIKRRRFLNETPPSKPLSRVNTDGSLFKAFSASSTTAQFVRQEDPWLAYRRLLYEDQAGPSIIAHKAKPNFPVVAIKERAALPQERYQRLAPTAHRNLVNLHEAFVSESLIFLVYECVTVTLEELQASPLATLVEYEIAAICTEVLATRFPTVVR